MLGCIGIFMALFVVNFIDYMKKHAEFGYVSWDIKTLTASDYTVEFLIDKSFYDRYE